MSTRMGLRVGRADLFVGRSLVRLFVRRSVAFCTVHCWYGHAAGDTVMENLKPFPPKNLGASLPGGGGDVTEEREPWNGWAR
jgi:hypothetical protein